MKLDKTDRNLLDLIQANFPLTGEPFSNLGKNLGISDTAVIQRIKALKQARIIRMIGPVFNPKMLGYQTTLAAMKVGAERLDETARIIASHPLVSHCYLREHEFNFWFTIALPLEDNMDDKLLKLGYMLKADATINLPAIKMFKIGTFFRLGTVNRQVAQKTQNNNSMPDKGTILSYLDRQIINELQQDLPLTLRPFDFMSRNLSISPDEFLNHCTSLIERRILRRYSASINHYSIGFMANAMTCWQVPLSLVEKAGKKIASFPEVSHCYQRRTGQPWHYNLFAMIHADTREKCQKLALQMSEETGLTKSEHVILFSTREIKKTRVRYPV